MFKSTHEMVFKTKKLKKVEKSLLRKINFLDFWNNMKMCVIIFLFCSKELVIGAGNKIEEEE